MEVEVQGNWENTGRTLAKPIATDLGRNFTLSITTQFASEKIFILRFSNLFSLFRSQSIGSITGAVNAYEDLCILFFDAHFDMRDPNASSYPMVHGSTLFFMLQDQVREAIIEWESKSESERNKNPKIG